MPTATEKWTDRWAFLATVPNVNFKIVSVTLLDWATAVVAFWMFLRRIDPTTAYDGWLFFLAGLNGFSMAQYWAKRSTDVDYTQAKNQPESPITINAPTPAPPAVTVQSPVAVQPLPSQVNDSTKAPDVPTSEPGTLITGDQGTDPSQPLTRDD